MESLTDIKQAVMQGDWAAVSQQLLAIPIDTLTSGEKSQVLELAIQVLTNGDFQDCWQVAKVLPALGVIAVDPLLAILADELATPEVQWFAGRVLGEFQDVTVVKRLAECLLVATSDPDSELAEIAVAALSHMGAVAIDQLTTLLDSNKLLAVTALAQIRHSRTIPPLLTVVDDLDPHIRAMAIEALSSFHDPQIPVLLIQKLTDRSRVVRQLAVTGLGLRADLTDELELVEKIRPLLDDLDLEVCLAAAISLGRLGNAAAAAALYSCAGKSTCPPLLVQQIVRSLGWIDLPETLQYLQEILSTGQLAVIPEVIRAIGQSHQPQAFKVLTDYLRTISPDCTIQIKQEIALNLGNFSKIMPVEEVINLLADDNNQVRWHVIYCLQQFDHKIVDDQLQQMSQSPETTPGLHLGIQQYLASRL